MRFSEMTIEEFLIRAASVQPTPGGGAVSAIACALGVSMASMVANLTLGKEKYAEVQKSMEQVVVGCKQLSTALLVAADNDAEAFLLVMQAYGLPQHTENEKVLRQVAIQHALWEAVKPPLLIANLCRDAIGQGVVVLQKGNSTAQSDAKVAIFLAQAALHSAVANIDANLQLLNEGERKTQLVFEKKELVLDASLKIKKVQSIIEGLSE